MSKVRLLGARLSSNPETKKVAHEQGLAGVVNVTNTGKLFYVTEALILKGMTPIVKSTMVWANDNNRFALSADDYNSLIKGEISEGELERFDDVPSYDVDGKTYTHVELLVMKGQRSVDVRDSWVKGQLNRNGAPKTLSTSSLPEDGAATPKLGETAPVVNAPAVTEPAEVTGP